MNVWTKVQKARVQLQNMNLKKSGENKFAGYEYYELQDFLPAINEIFAEVGLFALVSFTSEIASLTIINTDKPDEQIIFTSPMAAANLKGCHDIQNMGAVETYQRRYLYTMALEIVEHDPLDKTMNPNDAKTSQKAPEQAQAYKQAYTAPEQKHPPATQQQAYSASGNGSTISEKQIKYLENQRDRKKIPAEKFNSMLVRQGVTTIEALNTLKMNAVLAEIQSYLPVPTNSNDDLPF